MTLLKSYLVGNVKRMNDNNVRMAYIGRTAGLPAEIQETMQWASEETAKNTGTTLTLALNYGSRTEIVDATRSLVESLIAEAHQRGCSLEDLLQVDSLESRIDEQQLAANLYTAHMPDPDLVIRTSGEQRISNFLLWQIAYAEIFVTDRLWPDFRGIHMLEAIHNFPTARTPLRRPRRRHRRASRRQGRRARNPRIDRRRTFRQMTAPAPAAAPPKHPRTVLSTALATLLAALVLLPLLGHKPLAAWDEAIYANIAREMLHSPLVPLFNGRPWFEKPPLFLWLTTLCFRFFGLSAFSARLVSALSGVATVAVLHAFAIKRQSENAQLTAWLSTFILLATLGFERLAHVGETDILLALTCSVALVGLSLLQLHKARRLVHLLDRPRRRRTHQGGRRRAARPHCPVLP